MLSHEPDIYGDKIDGNCSLPLAVAGVLTEPQTVR